MHLAGDEERGTELAAIDALLERDDLGHEPLLKENADDASGAIRLGDERVDLRGGDVNRLLDEGVPAAAHRRDCLLGVQPRRAADRDHVQRMREEALEITIGCRTGLERQRRGLVVIAAVDGNHLGALNLLHRAQVRPGDSPSADDSYSHRRQRLTLVSLFRSCGTTPGRRDPGPGCGRPAGGRIA